MRGGDGEWGGVYAREEHRVFSGDAVLELLSRFGLLLEKTRRTKCTKVDGDQRHYKQARSRVAQYLSLKYTIESPCLPRIGCSYAFGR